MSSFDEYRLTSRGAKGVLTMNVTDRTGKLVALRAVSGDEDLMIITKAGIVIRMSLTQVKVAGRNTQGVRLIRLDEGQEISSIAVLAPEEEEEIAETPTEE